MKKRQTQNNYGGKEKRRYPRKSVNIRGSIVLDEGRRMSCQVTDISETGAMLMLETPIDLPTEFLLEFFNTAAVRRRCRKMRQEGATAGVNFPDRG